MDEKKFRETEAKYKDLKEKHARNEISTEQVKSDLKKLMVQDETGTYWMLGGKSGKWYRHDGTQWQEADPYESLEEEADDEPPFELDSAVKISPNTEKYSSLSNQEESVESKDTQENEIHSGSDVSDISYTPYATETSGNAETASDIDIGDIAYPTFTSKNTQQSAPKMEQINETEKPEEESSSYDNYDAYDSYQADSSYSTNIIQKPFKEHDSYDTGNVFQTESTQDDYPAYNEYGGESEEEHISLDSYESDSAEMPGADDFLDTGQPLDVTEPIQINEPGGTIEDSAGTYETNEAYNTLAIDASTENNNLEDEEELHFERQNTEEDFLEEEEASSFAVKDVDEIDTKRYEYTVHKGSTEKTEIALESEDEEEFIKHEDYKTPKDSKLEPASQPQPQEMHDFVTCGVCKSRIPPYAVYCSFCGAHQKSLKQRTSLKPVKEEGELLIKSIKITSLMFFFGGLGLIIGVIIGAIFGVFKDFLAEIATQLPMMLSETRGGPAGGLIFAAIGGIGGFIISAISAVLLSLIYNLIAFIFGGIRFKVKR